MIKGQTDKVREALLTQDIHQWTPSAMAKATGLPWRNAASVMIKLYKAGELRRIVRGMANPPKESVYEVAK